MYEVRALLVRAHRDGVIQDEGYVPFIVRSGDGGIVEFAVHDGNMTGNWQPRHPTPEAALAWYAEHQDQVWVGDPPEWGHLQKHRYVATRSDASTAGAV
jgi:hypothetical protein